MNQTIEAPGGDGSMVVLSQIDPNAVCAQASNSEGVLQETGVVENVLPLYMFRAAGVTYFFTPDLSALPFVKELPRIHKRRMPKKTRKLKAA
jgi:hypothetical protein